MRAQVINLPQNENDVYASNTPDSLSTLKLLPDSIRCQCLRRGMDNVRVVRSSEKKSCFSR